jgi:hypothetical protein
VFENDRVGSDEAHKARVAERSPVYDELPGLGWVWDTFRSKLADGVPLPSTNPLVDHENVPRVTSDGVVALVEPTLVKLMVSDTLPNPLTVRVTVGVLDEVE